MGIARISVLIASLSLAALLLFIHANQKFSEPEKTLSEAIGAAGAGDLSGIRSSTTRGYYEDLIGYFGALEHERVRTAYQTAYTLAHQRWAEYRQRAESRAEAEYKRLHGRVDVLGREAVGRLSVEERMQLTEDRGKYADFVFEEGIKALQPEDRRRIEDVEAFRSGRDFRRFTDREAWDLLSEEDRTALGNAAALSSRITAERLAFLEKVGIPLLSTEQKKVISGIPSSELVPAQAFMLKYGDPRAKDFFDHAEIGHKEIGRKAEVITCKFPEEDQDGSLLRGGIANCNFEMTVRGKSHSITAVLKREGFDWKLDSLQRDFFEIPEAYPPRQSKALPLSQPSAAAVTAEPAPPNQIETVSLPRASWPGRQATDESPPGKILKTIARDTSDKDSIGFILGVFLVLLFIVVMTINYGRLKNQKFVSELLDGEQQLDEVELPMWWMRTVTRLTNRRIIQIRLNWLFSQRKVYAIALDDVHSVVWRRYTNWLLLAIGIWLVGRINPLALLVVMLGLEAKIHSIRFNTPFSHMLWTNIVARSFHRKHFDALSRFFRKAQLHWAQVRTQKQLPVPLTTPYTPEPDRDFCWGIPVWVFVGLWMVLAVAQRIVGHHVSLDDYVIAPVLLALPIATVQRSRRDALWIAALGFTGMLTVKFPEILLPLGFTFGGDGGGPNFEQYFGTLGALVIATIVAASLARLSPALCYLAPVLWIGFVALFKPVQVFDTALYAKCALAIAASVLLSWLDDALSQRLTVVSRSKQAGGA